MRRKDREVTDRCEIEEIIKSCRVCHVAMLSEGRPYVLPLCYGYQMKEDGTLVLYFHSAKAGQKIDCLKADGRVCFDITLEGETKTAKPLCLSGCTFASVVGNGEVTFVEDIAEKQQALSCFYRQQTGEEAAFNEVEASCVCIFKVVCTDYTGKRRATI